MLAVSENGRPACFKWAKKLVDKGMGVPAILMLETMKPLSVVTQQTLYAATPLAVLGNFRGFHQDLTSIFESRQNMEELLLELERLMEERNE